MSNTPRTDDAEFWAESLSSDDTMQVVDSDFARELEQEIRYLRQYGNKECTEMADAARAKNELDDIPGFTP